MVPTRKCILSCEHCAYFHICYCCTSSANCCFGERITNCDRWCRLGGMQHFTGFIMKKKFIAHILFIV